jgi:hypothetical protein
MSEYVYPTFTGVVRWQGGRVRLVADQAWRGDDPLVQARPELFTSDPMNPQGTVRDSGDVPETATAAPGEQRTLPRRPSASRPARKATPPKPKKDTGAGGQ